MISFSFLIIILSPRDKDIVEGHNHNLVEHSTERTTPTLPIMNPDAVDTAEIAKTTLVHPPAARGSIDVEKLRATTETTGSDDLYHDDEPTEEEMNTLRRVSGKIPWAAFTIAFCELCERFSYYGSAVLYTNFVQWPLPEGSETGHDPSPNGQPGALNRGLQASVAIGLFNQFFAYLMPLVG